MFWFGRDGSPIGVDGEPNLSLLLLTGDRIGFFSASELGICFFSLTTRLETLVGVAGLRGPETGCNICLPNPRSFGLHIFISYPLPLQPGVPFGRKEVAPFFERRNRCKRALIKPERFRTTVAIIEVSSVGSFLVKVTNQGMTKV